MASVRWRRSLLMLCLVAATVCAYDALTLVSSGTLGLALTPTSDPFVERLTVDRDGPSSRTGLRSGDVLDLRSVSPAERYQWVVNGQERWNRDSVAVIARRDGVVRTVTVTPALSFPHRVPLQKWGIWLGYAAEAWLLSFAVLLAWRRPESLEARVLCLLIASQVLSLRLNSGMLTPWPSLDFILQCVSLLLSIPASGLLATYALLFACPVSKARRALAWSAYGAATFAAVFGLVGAIGAWIGYADPMARTFSGLAAQIVQEPLPHLVAVLSIPAAIIVARGAERARIVWAGGSLCIYFVVKVVALTIIAVAPSLTIAAFAVTDFAVVLVAMGLTYSLLRRRIVDVGFAINRAAVFSAVTGIIIATFVLIEWLVTKWFEGLTHTESVALSGIVALGLGVSIRALHHRVDHVVDSVFFRRRRDDEMAIRNFAEDAVYITDADALLQRTVDVLRAHAHATTVRVLLDDGAGRFGGISENDPVILAVRARRTVVDLSGIKSNIEGDFAFPMIARGRPLGVLVVGRKESNEGYAPDELGSIARAAHAVAGGLEILAARNDRTDAVLAAVADVKEALLAALTAKSAERKGPA